MGLLKEHFELRMQHKSAQLDDGSKLRKVKRSQTQCPEITISIKQEIKQHKTVK